MSETVKLGDDRSDFENDDQKSRLKELIDDARLLGCEAALRKHDHNVEYLTDLRRAKYIDLLELTPADDLLEIGASMGQHTRLMAKKCRTVEALEVVADQAEFAHLWCTESGLENIHFTVGGGSGKLPFADNSFSAVVMNYVLEWCAGRSKMDADDFHLQMLQEIQRVLKPGGRFFLSTKNRYGLRLLTGSIDEHLGIRFGNALPRWASRLLTKNVERDIPKGHLHSRGALERLLMAAGFEKLQPYLCFPDARRPDMIVPMDARSADALKNIDGKRHSRKDRLYLALPFFIQQYIATSHAYIALKPAQAGDHG